MTSLESFICVLCKESFTDKETLQIHFRKHGDPSFNKQIKTQSETEVSKEGDSKTELVSCDVCTEVFPTISKAITHKHKVHPEHDAKYFCHWCGKLFTLKHLFNKHLTSHGTMIKGDEVFHCDCCNVDFYIPSAMNYHNKFFHRQDTDLPVLGHSRKQKFVNKELMQLYYCAFCGEEYINKVNLHKHMKDEHGDENQSPEVVLRCPLCEAVFYHLDAYEIHLTFHSSEDIYNGKDDDVRKDDITEFTLDTVPPVTEKVEELKPEDEQSNAVNIDEFLQLAMEDNEEVSGRKKHKKHKKHKKSKKDAITLDEFLNMNSDVFGEGLDFQGVEEVPTKVVKRLSAKSKPQKVFKTVTKVSATPELEKLKQLGIAIKTNTVKRPTLAPGIRIKNAPPAPVGKTVKTGNIITSNNQTPVKPTNEDVLSKLLSQSQNQIVISKKPVNVSSANPEPNSSPTVDVFDGQTLTPEKLEVQCDVRENSSSELGPDDKINSGNDKAIPEENVDGYNSEKSDTNDQKEDENNKSDCEDKDIVLPDEGKKKSNSSDDKIAEECPPETPNASILKSISQRITIKSISNSKPSSPVHTQSPAKVQTSTQKVEVNKLVGQVVKEAINENTTKKNSLDVLKNLGHLTIKSSQKTPEITEIARNDQDCANKQILNTKILSSTNVANADNTSIESLKKINPNITIKSQKSSETLKSNVDKDHDADDEFDQHESDHPSEDEDEQESEPLSAIQTKPNVSTTPAVLKNIGQGITIKPTGAPRSHNFEKKTNKDIDQKDSKNSLPVQMKQNKIQTFNKLNSQLTIKPVSNSPVCRVLPSKEISKDEEIFSVDDSDSDDIESKLKTQAKPGSINAPNRPIQKTAQTVQSMPARPIIRNYPQNVIVKNEENVSEMHEDEEVQGDASDDNDSFDDAEDEIKPNVIPKPQAPNIAQKLLENKNISIKNINSSAPKQSPTPNIAKTSSPQNSPNNIVMEGQTVKLNPSSNYNTGTKNIDSNPSKTPLNPMKILNKPQNISNNPPVLERQIVKYNPNVHYSDSDEDAFPDLDELSNHSNESDCPPANVQKQKMLADNDINKNLKDFDFDSDEQQLSDNQDDGTCGSDSQSIINKLKNMNQNLSIKSSSQNSSVAGSSSNKINNLRNNLPLQSFNDNKRQTIQNRMQTSLKRESTEFATDNDNNDDDTDNAIATSSKQIKVSEQTRERETREPVGQSNKINVQRSAQMRQVNQQVATNTVNQQVTTSVRTIQSETVVEEITTTVTRTIKTINKEVSMSGNQTLNRVNVSSPNIIRGPRPRLSSSLQGVAVRQAAAGPARPRMRQAVPARPVGIAGARAPNQITPIRPSLNQVRSANPRMPVRVRPPTTPTQPRPTRPIKIAQNVQQVLSKVNRAPEENQGHFSCFKKPKQSLIPMDSSDDEGIPAGPHNMDLGNSSNISKSVVEMKSEVMSSSHQQISKLSSVSGLKIVKSSSQSKQVVNKVEKFEVSSNSTQSAIERLQRQGLLVKKPRLEAADDDGGFLAIEGPP